MSILGNVVSLRVRIGLVMGVFALATVVGPIDEMIKTLQKAKEDGYEYFAFMAKAFKSEDLRPILNAPRFAILLFKDMSEFSDEAKRLIEESTKKGDGDA